MKFTTHYKPFDKIKTEVLVVFGFEDKITAEEKAADKFFDGQLQKLRSSKDFTGGDGKIRLFSHSADLPRVLLAGLGKHTEFSLEKLRSGISAVVLEFRKLPVREADILLPVLPRMDNEDVARAASETIILANYQFHYYKKPESQAALEKINLIPSQKRLEREAVASCHRGELIGNAVAEVRDLGNHPSNVATPTHLAEHALRIARADRRIKVKILHRSDIKKEKMGSLLAVSQGSDEEPKFIILEYRPRKNAPFIALVGKGITFDSGGISIKPSDKMEEMKYDMAGAATVMGIIKVASELKLPVNLVGLIPATENLPSGKASKPGDIVRSRSGKTIEIVNTDAEGRLVLADALDYAKKYNPALIVDFATLTGAIVVALGDDLIGAFANRENLLPKLRAAAEKTGEKVWPMPLEKDYEQFIKSDFADLRNIGLTRYGDSINAANFLKEFVGDTPWIHLDIAGVAWTTREKPYRPKGATGTGVRLAIEFLKKFRPGK